MLTFISLNLVKYNITLLNKIMKKLLYLLLVFNLISVQILYAQKSIKGTVYDDGDKSPLPGVNVVVEGSAIGGVTDLNGTYQLSVPEGKGTLVFTFIGMKTQKVSIEGKTTIDVYMSEEDNALNEVVLTALGIKREEKALGYAVQEVKGEDAIANGNPNPISGLQGKVAGIQVVQSSGTPGSSSKVLIRGNATFGNNQPLIVIDGVPIDNSTTTSYGNNVGGVDQSNRAIDINPDDIESVSVLKGAAATSLYGSRAGNGVIIYTTKKSNTGGNQNMRGTFSSDVTFTRPVNLHKKQDIYGQSAAGSSGTAYSWGDVVSNSDKVDAMDDFFKTGIAQNYNLSLSGGNKQSSTRFSVGYTDAKGIIPNSYWDRLSTRLTASTQLTDRLSASGTVNLINSGGNRPQKGSNIAGVMLSLYRSPINYDPRAAYYDDPVTKGTNSNYFVFYDNPYYSAEHNTYKDNVWRVIGNVNLTYDLLGPKLKDKFTTLSLMYRSGLDSYSDTRKGQSPIGSNTTDNKQGMIVDYSGTFFEWNNDYILNGGKMLNDRVNLSFILGANARTRKDEYVLNTGTSLIENNFYNIANAQSVVSNQYTTLINEYAAYTDLTFSLDNMVYLGLSGRNEWSSNYSKDNNSHFYPAANASFVFTELMEKEDQALTFGKFRASIGRTGIAPSPWRYANYTTSVAVQDGFSDGNTTATNGALLTNFGSVRGNSNLEPEIQIGKEIGFDLRFWDGRLTFDLGLYQQDISNLLVNVPVSSATGFLYDYKNIGEMRNRGIELSIGGDIIRNKDLTWTANFNYGLNRNKVLNLNLTSGNDDRVAVGGGFTSIAAYAAEGEAFGVFYGTTWERDANGNLLVDDNGLYIETADKVKIGDPNPDFNLGLKNTVSFKNWTFNMFIDGSFGGDVYNGTKSMMNFRGIGIDTEDRTGDVVLQGVHADGTVNTTPISKQEYWQYIEGIASAASAKVEKNINYVKLRELGVTYNFKLNKNAPIDNLSFSLIGTNLLTITNYSDGDPETSLTGAGSNTSGFDYFNSPNTRGIVFKVGATF